MEKLNLKKINISHNILKNISIMWIERNLFSPIESVCQNSHQKSTFNGKVFQVVLLRLKTATTIKNMLSMDTNQWNEQDN